MFDIIFKTLFDFSYGEQLFKSGNFRLRRNDAMNPVFNLLLNITLHLKTSAGSFTTFFNIRKCNDPLIVYLSNNSYLLRTYQKIFH